MVVAVSRVWKVASLRGLGDGGGGDTAEGLAFAKPSLPRMLRDIWILMATLNISFQLGQQTQHSQ